MNKSAHAERESKEKEKQRERHTAKTIQKELVKNTKIR